MKKTIAKLFLILAVIATLTLTSCDAFNLFPGLQPDKNNKPDTENNVTPDQKPEYIPGITMKEDNLMLGYPDMATKNNPTDEANYLIERNAYSLSYNNNTHNPNWVSWHLGSTDMGKIKRTDPWTEDTTLPASFGPRVEHSDYTGSGFSRGHMCPNAARNGEKTRQNETFIFTNIIPQEQDNNGGPWEKLESHIQSACRSGVNEAYIISGPWGEGGVNKDSKKMNYIYVPGKNIKITVPAYTWKVFIVIESGENDVERINEGAKIKEAFGVWIPNNHDTVDARDYYDKYKVSIDFIEDMTGYDFFSEINEDIQAEFESNYSELDPVINPVFMYEEPAIEYNTAA